MRQVWMMFPSRNSGHESRLIFTARTIMIFGPCTEHAVRSAPINRFENKAVTIAEAKEANAWRGTQVAEGAGLLIL